MTKEIIEKIPFGKDLDGKIMYKIKNPDLSKSLKFFNSSDVLLGNPMSNVAVAFIYNWRSDEPPQDIKDLFVNISNYTFLTGYWRTTNGAKYAFSNILLNPNVNKLIVCIFNTKDNGHLLVDAIRCFWKNGLTEDGLIKSSQAANPRFEGLTKDGLERIKKQTDLIIIERATKEKIEEAVKACIQEPANKRSIEGIEVLPTSAEELYDCGARFDNPYESELSHTDFQDIDHVPESEIISTLGLSITADDLDDALKKIVKQVFEKGSVLKDQRKISIREERSLSVVTTWCKGAFPARSPMPLTVHVGTLIP